jgi:hypothetical protein
MITVSESDNFDIGANPSADGQGEDEGTSGTTSAQVINVVHAHRLSETSFDKKAYMGYIKAYMKRVLDHLKEKNPARADAFQKAIQPFIKSVLENFNDYSFYTGGSVSYCSRLCVLFLNTDHLLCRWTLKAKSF